MRVRLAVFNSLLCLLLLATVQGQTERRTPQNNRANVSSPAPNIAFTVSIRQPHTHLLEVEMRLNWTTGPAPVQVNLVMPVWTPGSYLVREYARHVQDFAAKDERGTKLLQWRKANKNTWRIETSGERNIAVSYRVYANELTVRTNELNDRHAFWNNAALLMYPEGHLLAPSTVRVVPHKESWKIATGLPLVEGTKDTFRAENFDLLYDSPFLVSDFKKLTFEVRGVPHYIVIDGEGNYDEERMRRDVQKIVETTVAIMGDIPYRDYTFILMLHPTARGGLEHLNSTALIWRRFNFQPASEYRDFLGLVAHEYFHLWNVKRIKPDALGPFDYTEENYTRLLWVAEGLTSYYQSLLVRRAGLMTDKEFLEEMASAFQLLQNTPGRLEVSLEESSFDAWIKYYRPDENSVNSSISYYDKGAIVGCLLDLEIRRASKGARALDDVMRHLYTEFAKKGRNYTPEDFQRVCEQMAGTSLAQFFNRYVRGRDELDYNASLEAAGLRLATTDGANASSEKAYLGATFARVGEQVLGRTVSEGTLTIKTVPAGTPAYDQGLNVGDQILALDGVRTTTKEDFDARLNEKRPGDTAKLTIFRLDDLRTFDLKLGGRAKESYRIVPIREASAEQKKIYQDWLGAAFPQSATGPTASGM